MSDLSCVKCGRHFDAAAACCPECGHVRGEPVSVWPAPLLPGANRWRRPLTVLPTQPIIQSVEPIRALELDEVFDDAPLHEAFAVPRASRDGETDDGTIALEDFELLNDTGDTEKTVVQPQPSPEPEHHLETLASEFAVNWESATSADGAKETQSGPAVAFEEEQFSWDDIVSEEVLRPPSEHPTELNGSPSTASSAPAQAALAPPSEPAVVPFASTVLRDSPAEVAPPKTAAAADLEAEIALARLAPWWHRLLAGVIDLIPIAGGVALTLVLVEPTLTAAHLPLVPRSFDEIARAWWALGWRVILIGVATFGTAFLYQGLTFIYMQGTVGDFLLGIVWITRAGRKPGVIRSLWRATWFVLGFALFGAGYWFALLLRTGRPFYDVVSGVYAVKRKSLVRHTAPLLAPAAVS